MFKISIITINRNNAEGLRKTMESVFRQTYRQLEYIVIDGASTDGSVDIIKDYVNRLEGGDIRLDNFKWISEPDTGIYNAMNKGIRKATGEYCLFLNSGDFLIAPEVIERVGDQCNGADLLCARCNVSDKGKVVWTSNPPEKVTFGTLYTVGLAHQSTFIKRSLFETCGMYREDFRYNSDIAFWYKSIVDNIATTQRIDVITTDYNLDGISSTENQNEQFRKEKSLILAPYQVFTPDYEAMIERERQNKLWYWVKDHRALYKPMVWIYNFANILNKKK